MDSHKLLIFGLLAVMVVVIVGIDVVFFREHFWLRFVANVGIVLVCLAFYARFLA